MGGDYESQTTTMTTSTRTSLVTIQGATGGQATTQTPAPPPTPTREQQQELQDAARQLRDAIRQNVNEQVINARASAAAAKALRAQGVVVTTPGVPQGPSGFGPVGGPLTIQTPDGKTTIIQPRGSAEGRIPPEAVDISVAFFLTVAAIIIFLPLARAFARRMDRRTGPAQVPQEVSAQLEHLNRAVDAIALEVERISEGQRFTTRLLTDQREAAQSLTTGVNR